MKRKIKKYKIISHIVWMVATKIYSEIQVDICIML